MAEELEIKLSLTPVALNQAAEWLSAQTGVSIGAEKTLINRYYDTPAGDLNHQKVALRVRQAGDKYIQTLKTKGEFVDGAHRRQEWEWPLTGTELNLGLIADTPVGEGINLAELTPVFETNFRRRVVMLENAKATIECALDQGTIEVGGRSRDLCELELELKEGSPDALLAWARELAAQVPVFLNLISKAEQGYALAGLYQPSALPDSEPLVNRVFHGLARAWLSGSTDRELEADLDTLAARPGFPASLARDVTWLRDQLQAGESVAGLARKSVRLGQFQLALLAKGEE
ncbi:CYTH domain-containing protein [Marinobacter bryozoorum]|uniref:CYTH domain-containing protein n=1 Tax=Marinobacter bryozoorum TaxID=256324 RepID=UPI002003E2F1|nr:CYTH domain-containing protein [Marinobacter bryozoorum]MCK7544789.1 CYTH domain-containing protein [Marinobacter bryozoorum]